MRKGLRIALATAAVAAGLAVKAPAAQAQVEFRGSFPAPHGRISIGFGDPYFRVGSYVPSYHRVYSHPQYGYGFAYRSRWIPVRRYRTRWVVVQRPVVVDRVYDRYYDDGYGDGYGYGYDSRYSHDYRYDGYGYRSHGYDPYCTR